MDFGELGLDEVLSGVELGDEVGHDGMAALLWM